MISAWSSGWPFAIKDLRWIAILLYSLPASAQFSVVSSGPHVTDGQSSSGVAWIDYDNDGYDDLFVTMSSATGPISTLNALYRNNGNGTFTKITTGDLVNEPGQGRSTIWADYDNDGYIDAYEAKSNQTALHRNTGSGFVKITALPSVSSGGDVDHSGGAWGDYDQDGYLDLFLSAVATNPAGKSSFFKNLGNGTFSQFPGSHVVAQSASSLAPSWIDFNNSGSLDLFVSNYTQSGFLYSNDGTGVFQDVSATSQLAIQGLAGSWADYDNDGDFDVLVNYNVNSHSTLFENNGNGTFTAKSTVPLRTLANAVCWADYNNDGWIDIAYVTGDAQGKQYLFKNNGDKTFTDVSSTMGFSMVGYSQAIAASDFDKDGFIDFFIANGEGNLMPLHDVLYHNTPNSNHWIQLRLIGTNTNRSAIGAVVRISSGGIRQMRTIQSNSGFNSQSSLTVHFGLGTATTSDTVQIEWPARGFQELLAQSGNNFYNITEIDFPNPPSQLTATPDEDFVHLAWTDNSSNETGFRIERAKNNSKSYKVIATVAPGLTVYNDAEVPAGLYSYRVASTTTNGFSTYSPVAQVTVVTGLSEQSASAIAIYPNPVERFLTISKKDNLPRELIIRDLTGRIVVTQQVIQNKELIDLGNLTPGLYLCRIGEFHFKVIRK